MACCQVAVQEEIVDQLGNGRFARELCRKVAAARDLRLYERRGGIGTPTREETTTLRTDDLLQAYRELSDSVAAR